MEAIHLDYAGGQAAHVAHEGTLPHCGLGIEPGAVKVLASDSTTDSEVAYAKRGEILEEVSTLRGLYVATIHTELGYETRSRDIGPLDRYAQRHIGTAPTALTYQDIARAIGSEGAVEGAYLIGNGAIVGHGEGTLLEVDDVVHIGDDAVAE